MKALSINLTEIIFMLQECIFIFIVSTYASKRENTQKIFELELNEGNKSLRCVADKRRTV